MNNKLLQRLAETSTVKQASVLSDSIFFTDRESVSTPVPLINLALSGSLTGGFTSGLTTFAGPSKHFKTASCLVAVKSYLDKYKDGICLYYDTEFGAPPDYIAAAGIDITRVLHVPILHVEQLKFDISRQLDEMKRGDKVIIFIDSIGNIASKKEVEDALEGKSVADMSRAKQIKSLFRIITQQIKVKDLPCFVVNHTYKTQDMYPSDVMSGGTGPMYSSDTVIIVGKSQDKDADGLRGFKFTYKIEKSRFVREKSQIPIEVSFEGGISRFSGLLDLALEAKVVVKPSNGWFSRSLVNPETGEITTEDRKWRRDDTNCNEFWSPVLKNKAFLEWIDLNFRIANKQLVEQDNTLMETDDE